MNYPVFKYKGKLYSEAYWIDGEGWEKYAGDVVDLLNLLEKENKLESYTTTYYKFLDGDRYEEDPEALLKDKGEAFGIETVEDV